MPHPPPLFLPHSFPLAKQVSFCFSIFFSGFEVSTPLYLVDIYKVRASDIGFLLATYGVILILTQVRGDGKGGEVLALVTYSGVWGWGGCLPAFFGRNFTRNARPPDHPSPSRDADVAI